MEPTLIKNNKDIKNQKKVIIALVFIFICLFIGTSYSLLTSFDETEEVITFKAGDLNLEVKTSTDTTVTLKDELPKLEEEVTDPIILNMKNTGSLEICEYRLKLVADESSSSNLATSFIRYSVSSDEGLSYSESKLLSETENLIYTGFDLKPNATIKLYLKVWIDESAIDNQDVLSKDFYGNIDAELLQKCETEKPKVVAVTAIKNTLGQEGGIIGVKEDNTMTKSKEDEVREYRYSGKNVNNYVYFNCKDNQPQNDSNCEKWRIIGVFKDADGTEKLKIVRKEKLNVTQIPENYSFDNVTYKIASSYSVYWNYDTSKSQNQGSNDWSKAGLQYWLNSKGTGDAGYLNTLSNDAQNMIADATYYLGNISVSSSGPTDKSTKELYQEERGNEQCSSTSACEAGKIWPDNQATWKGKIGLMYPSDFGFSIDSQYWDTVLKWSFGLDDFYANTWMGLGLQWFISPTNSGTMLISYLAPNGIAYEYTNYNNDVYPTLYLNSDVKLISGQGTDSDPYQLEIKKN